MKILTLIFTTILGVSSVAQEFIMPAEEYPFFDIIEWKGNGALLLNRDPSGLKRKINLTMVGEKTTSIWQESFNPTGKEYYYIHSENARYVYFLEQLQPVEGKVSFSQINIAGNVKNSTAVLATPIKKLGDYDITELKMIDVFTTDKALVFLMRHHDKKEKRFTDLLVTMTHHNMLVYASKLGDTPEANLKEPGKYGFWTYAGNQGENIIFYAKDQLDKKSGFTLQTFTSKAEKTESRFIECAAHNFDAVPSGSFGTTGRYYLNNQEVATGQLHFINGKYFHSGIRTDGTKKLVELYALENLKWTKIKSVEVAPSTDKKVPGFSSVALNEGIASTYGGKSVFLPFTADPAVTNTVTAFTPFNPSSTMIKDLKGRFAVSLPTGSLFFETKQLNNPGAVKFEFLKK
jgi:hypothetical protein